MKSGIINIYKEAGYTSFDVIARLRGILGIKKIGHTGTLDPEATGVLPVCIGKATKLCDMLTDKDKCYRAKMHLGVETDTQDATGNILREREVCLTPQEIEEAVFSFVGETEQIPPMYSALKVNGQKLCDLARKGIEVERKPRKIQIYEIRILEMAIPYVTMEVSCAKGTYIRTLCHDIGQKLGCGACMESLVRTRVSVFSIEDSIRLDEVERRKASSDLESVILPIDDMFQQYPKILAKADYDKKLTNGNALPLSETNCGEFDGVEQSEVRMYLSDGRFVGIFYWKDGLFQPKRMFLE